MSIILKTKCSINISHHLGTYVTVIFHSLSAATLHNTAGSLDTHTTVTILLKSQLLYHNLVIATLLLYFQYRPKRKLSACSSKLQEPNSVCFDKFAHVLAQKRSSAKQAAILEYTEECPIFFGDCNHHACHYATLSEYHSQGETRLPPPLKGGVLPVHQRCATYTYKQNWQFLKFCITKKGPWESNLDTQGLVATRNVRKLS